MPTAVISVPVHNGTNEAFRTWGKALSDALNSVGLVKVPDAGTVDWATVNAPTAYDTPMGFEVWRFDDALQTTHPIYFKIEYGSQVLISQVALWVTIGRGTNGTGTITGVLAPRRSAAAQFVAGGGDAPVNIEPTFVSSDGSSLAVSMRVGANVITRSHTPAFVIDRSRDSEGNPTAAGGVILTEGTGEIDVPVNATTTLPAQMHAWTYAGDSTMGDVPAVLPDKVNGVNVSSSTTLAVGDKAPVFPYVVAVPNHDPWQILAAVAVVAGDAANGPFTANVLGRVRTYRSIPVGGAHNRWMAGTQASGHSGLCILWEE